MRYILILLLMIGLHAQSYNFDEYKYIFAANQEFKQSGRLSFEGNKTIITYSKPKYKQIISDDEHVTIEGASGKSYRLKGKGLFYTKLFIDIMTRLGKIQEIKSNRDFDVKKDAEIYFITFKGEMQDQVPTAEVKTKNSKVVSFKLFMKNSDTLEIIKR